VSAGGGNGRGGPAASSPVPPAVPPAPGAGVAPEFTVAGAAFVEDAAAPTMRFDLGAEERSGREVFTIALTAQINVDPSRRSYDAETRARLVELFGEPERWAATTHSFVWTHASTLVQSFTGSTIFSLPVACTYDLELAATKYFYSLPGGHVPLTFHFSGSVLHRGDDGRIQVVAIPWSCSARWRMPVATWREMMRRHYPNGSWVRLHADTTERLRRHAAGAGAPTLDAAVNGLLDAAAVAEAERR
jgi:Family of unknown function (DUF6084)